MQNACLLPSHEALLSVQETSENTSTNIKMVFRLLPGQSGTVARVVYHVGCNSPVGALMYV